MPFVHPVISRKYVIYFFAAVFLLILCGCKKSDGVAIKVGPVAVTQSEFEKAFRESRLSDDSENRRIFAEQYVNKKLILIDAERRGIDKDPEFLSEIQSFWEERLLKASMLGKFEEYAPVIRATDEEVNKIYEESKTSKALPEDPAAAKEQIRVMIAQEKQNQLLAEWIDSLKKKTRIHVDERRLGLKK